MKKERELSNVVHLLLFKMKLGLVIAAALVAIALAREELFTLNVQVRQFAHLDPRRQGWRLCHSHIESHSFCDRVEWSKLLRT